MALSNNDFHRVTATAVIRKDGPLGSEASRYLIVKRNLNKKAFPGKWTVPGGGLEVSDYINTPKTTADCWYFSLENSLKREIKEEVSLEVKDLKYLLSLTFISPDNIPVITLSFYCAWQAGEVGLNEENTDYKWVTVGEAKNYDLIGGILEEIQSVDNILKEKNNT